MNQLMKVKLVPLLLDNSLVQQGILSVKEEYHKYDTVIIL